MTNPPPRLIDLHCDWLLQYAEETTVFPAELYPGVARRIRQAEGYLSATQAAVVSCYRRSEDWARQADPWSALAALIARIEAEFPGRLLIGSDDHARWLAEPDEMCWAVIGVEGFDSLVQTPADLERLPRLFDRGVRLFQPVYSATNGLAGSSAAGDDRGLTDLGRRFLETLAAVDRPAGGPSPALDLAHMNPTAMSDALDWLEASPGRLIPVYSHGAPVHDGYTSPRALTDANLHRLRALGGWIGLSVGPPFFQTADEVKAAADSIAEVPYLGRAGFEGLAIGTDFLGVDQTLPELGRAEDVSAWLLGSFGTKAADRLIHANARTLLAALVGAEVSPTPVGE